MLNKISCLLHRKWSVDLAKDTEDANFGYIRGFWAEDNSQYIIKVPMKLRDPIISMQNWLSDKYNLIKKFENEIRDINIFFREK